jgi:hypothetical protein
VIDMPRRRIELAELGFLDQLALSRRAAAVLVRCAVVAAAVLLMALAVCVSSVLARYSGFYSEYVAPGPDKAVCHVVWGFDDCGPVSIEGSALSGSAT